VYDLYPLCKVCITTTTTEASFSFFFCSFPLGPTPGPHHPTGTLETQSQKSLQREGYSRFGTRTGRSIFILPLKAALYKLQPPCWIGYIHLRHVFVLCSVPKIDLSFCIGCVRFYQTDSHKVRQRTSSYLQLAYGFAFSLKFACKSSL